MARWFSSNMGDLQPLILLSCLSPQDSNYRVLARPCARSAALGPALALPARRTALTRQVGAHQSLHLRCLHFVVTVTSLTSVSADSDIWSISSQGSVFLLCRPDHFVWMGGVLNFTYLVTAVFIFLFGNSVVLSGLWVQSDAPD